MAQLSHFGIYTLSMKLFISKTDQKNNVLAAIFRNTKTVRF